MGQSLKSFLNYYYQMSDSEYDSDQSSLILSVDENESIGVGEEVKGALVSED